LLDDVAEVVVNVGHELRVFLLWAGA
jgi:hypothetical protein